MWKFSLNKKPHYRPPKYYTPYSGDPQIRTHNFGNYPCGFPKKKAGKVGIPLNAEYSIWGYNNGGPLLLKTTQRLHWIGGIEARGYDIVMKKA